MTSLSGNKTVSSTIYSTASTTNNNLIITNISFANIEGYKLSGNIIEFNTLNLLSNIVAPNLQGNVIGSIIGNITQATTGDITYLIVGNITGNNAFFSTISGNISGGGNITCNGITVAGTVVCQNELDSGNITAANVNCGNLYCGGNLTITPKTLITGNVIASNVNANVWVGGNLGLSPGTLGPTIVTSSLTSVGTLSSLNVSGQVSCGSEVDSGNLVAANVNAGNVYCGGNLVIGPGLLGSTVTASSLTSLGTLSSLNVGGLSSLVGNINSSGGSLYLGGSSITSGAVLTQGTYQTWNNDLRGESDFICKYGSGTGGFFFYTSAGSGNTKGSAAPIAQITPTGIFGNSISANVNLAVGTTTLPSGFVFRTLGYASLQQVCYYITASPAQTFTFNQSFFWANSSPTTVVSLMPSTYSTATYGLQQSGTYNGYVVVPVSGVYSVGGHCRFKDDTSAGTNSAAAILKYDGSTYTVLLPGDGASWAAPDGSGRRSVDQIAMANMTAGQGIGMTVASGVSCFVQYAGLTITLINAT